MLTSVSFYTLGCKLNHVETSSIVQQFIRSGFNVVDFTEKADVVVINSCTVTTSADAECRQIISRAKKNSPGAPIVVTGCYAERDPDSIASIEGVTAVVGNSDKHRLVDVVSQKSIYQFPSVESFVAARSMGEDNRTRAFVKLQDGCDYTCTFCTIPRVRGSARAMPIQDVQSELALLRQSDCREVVLTGVNLGEYKAPTGERLIDVLRLFEQASPNFRIRISSIEPNTVTQEIIRLIAQSKIFVPHFHIPLQSGSAEILRSMKRRYNPTRYADLVHRIKESMPHAAIGIDVITGFPGESDELFEETYTFLTSLPFSYLHVFTYSERPETPAAAMLARVPERIRKQRTNRLRVLSSVKRRDFEYGELSAERTVIPEHYEERYGGWVGWTENYIRCVVREPKSATKEPRTLVLTEDNVVGLLPASAESADAVLE
ncbi:MAG: tRNA (N(6)-L-threonylcarbamoyladenosine(37)-C(2))-methylthiotransferase MtaB [Ignavibacteria bacterium]|nr:tRNA (N(6)-L-threonylcarbamoyladenosine(37)-C(2))-methylthiotransferase MtaB [Ignavibacteria bacterium]